MNRRILTTTVGAAIVAMIIGAIRLRGPSALDFGGGPTVALSDYEAGDPTGVPPELASANIVERGAYLAHAADCSVCHTSRGGKEYAGGLAFRLPFGTLYSTNITADKETGIGNYTDAEFVAAVRHGTRRDGARLYPAMPYTSYAYLTDADTLAIKAYLFHLAPVSFATPANTLGFPFDQRWVMGLWSAVFNQGKQFEPNVSKSLEWNRGAYLIEALAHCGECHTPRNVAFATDNRQKFAGAVTAGWRAFNISSDAVEGLGGWRDEEIATYLMTGHAQGRGTASGPMGEAVDESFSQLTPQDLELMVAYLRSVPAAQSGGFPTARAPAAPASHKESVRAVDAHGKEIFEGSCVSCHGWTGDSGISPLANLTGTWAVNDPSATNVAQIVLSGADRRTPQGAIAMPAFGAAFSDEEIAAVANYVTARFGSKPSQIEAEDVTILRKQTGSY